MMTHEAILARIRGLPAFVGIPDADLDRLLGEARVRELAPGDVLIVEGEEAQVAYLILDGTVEISRSAGDGEVVVATRHAGELVGEMALLMKARRNATVRSQTRTTVLEITGDGFQSVLASRPETAISMLRTVWERLQSAEAHLVQHQKMAALGTLAAGLAHELNNPAAALVRSAEQLAEVVASWEVQADDLGGLSLSAAERQTIHSLRRSFAAIEPFAEMDPIVRADLEDELQHWLEQHAVGEPWRLASLLVEASATTEELDRLAASVDPAHLPALVWWYGSGVLVQRLLRELSISGRAISEVVRAVKGYVHLDQAPIQEIDIHEGIDQALVILRHKLRGVRVEREYADSLPRITAYAGEINQVWTNLIDNAADVLDGDGTVTIRTRLEGDDIFVDVEDNGPGIPQAVQDCIFNPFYTTKPPGEGTGLGLAISFNIVHKHGGDVRLESQPGCTRFTVRLPVESDIG